MKTTTNKSFQTRAVHAGERVPPADFTPVTTPIWTTVGYLYDSMDDLDTVFDGKKRGQVYLRYSNPTTEAFENAIADLEMADAAQAYSSGMAAIHAALLAAGVKAGTAVVAALDVYGATFSLLNSLFKSMDVTLHMVDVTNHAEVESALKESRAIVLFAETISNPLLKVADIPALAGLARRYGASLLVDNTFATPYMFNPIAHGADMCIHSATKYISGHGDTLAGVVATTGGNKKKLFELNKLVGSVLGPFEAWLALRGLKTLPLRMKQHCRNANRIAEWLTKHPRVAKVNYPGLDSHPQHSLAEKLFQDRYGGMLSFELKDAGRAEAYRFMEALEICLPATTLGDVYSLVLHPATSSHRSLTPEQRAQVGISDGLVRLSAGIEDVEDILSDLEKALDVIR